MRTTENDKFQMTNFKIIFEFENFEIILSFVIYHLKFVSYYGLPTTNYQLLIVPCSLFIAPCSLIRFGYSLHDPPHIARAEGDDEIVRASRFSEQGDGFLDRRNMRRLVMMVSIDERHQIRG